MKFLAKINRGLILTAAVVLAVIIYLIVLEIGHSAAKPKIESICKDYVKTAISYEMLPEKYRVDKPSISQSELNSYLDQMETDIKAFYPDNPSLYKYTLSEMKTSLQNQAKGNGTVFKYTKDILNFKSITFDGNTATATIVTNASYDGPSNTNSVTGISSGRNAVSGQTTDTITLQKTGEKWHVVYANLQQPSSGANAANEKSYTGTTTIG